jgi:glycosyltransferase involved in cell wall biosynthesis
MPKSLYVGYPGFPLGLAQVQRQLLISKGLVEHGCQVKVLSRYGIHSKDRDKKIFSKGNFEGVDYVFCSGTPYRPKQFIIRNLLKIIGFFNELRIIIQERFKYNADVIIITSNNIRGIIYYHLLAKILGYTSVVDQVEYWSAQKNSTTKKIDSFFNDRYYGNFADKIIVISDFLLTKLKKKYPRVPVIKIPAICDFSKFQAKTKAVNKEKYFLYCGSVNYFEVVTFILDAYAKIKSKIGLVMVVSGNKSGIEKVNSYIAEKNIKSVVLKSNIPYDELVSLYKNSLALLIPLRPTLQDIARFPHKLGEYTASKRPIISTQIGEVAVYFKDGENAFLSKDYNILQFSKKMQEVINSPELRENIAERSFKTGEQEFDYFKNGTKLFDFLFNN